MTLYAGYPGHFLLLSFAVVFCGCADNAAPPASTPPATEAAYIECKEPRPQMCTQQYDPVCASRDTGIRCVTTPCDSSEWLRYPNACVACSDKKVYGYRDGDCDPADTES